MKLIYIKRSLEKKLYIILSIPAIFLMFLFFISIFLLFTQSFSYFDTIKGITTNLTLSNYLKFFTDYFYISVLLTTLFYGLLITVLTLLIGYPLAFFLAKTTSKRKGLFLAIVLFPFFLNIVVRSYGWIVFLADGGLLNNLLKNLHIIEQPIKLLFTMKGVVVGLTHIFLPFMVLSILGAIQNIRTDYEEAAMTLGANKLKVFLKITLPLSLPGIVSGSVLVFLLTVTAFVTPRLLGGATFKTMTILIFQEFMFTFNWPFGSAMAFIILIATLMIIYTFYKVIKLERRRFI